MSRRIVSLTLDTLEDLPQRCRHCVFWELDPVSRNRTLKCGDPGLEKEAYVPRSIAFPTSPVSSDAALLMTAHIVEPFAGQGLGRMLVQSLAKDLVKRGLKAVEAFADLEHSEPDCVVPADYLLAVGFKTVRPHPRWPRMRLELRTAVSWRSDVEYALEKLLGSMTPQVALRRAEPRT
jgi:hypothetical protein